jgi:hypothetical protein
MDDPNVSTNHRSQPSRLVDVAASWFDLRQHSGGYQLARHREGSPGRQTNAYGDAGQAFCKRREHLLFSGGFLMPGSVIFSGMRPV